MAYKDTIEALKVKIQLGLDRERKQQWERLARVNELRTQLDSRETEIDGLQEQLEITRDLLGHSMKKNEELTQRVKDQVDLIHEIDLKHGRKVTEFLEFQGALRDLKNPFAKCGLAPTPEDEQALMNQAGAYTDKGESLAAYTIMWATWNFARKVYAEHMQTFTKDE